MKTISLVTLALSILSTNIALANAFDDAREADRRDQMNRRLIPRGEKHAPSNCGFSFWSQSVALRACPVGTAKKSRARNGRVFFYCRCSN
jgi:hypothetical protein